LREPVWRRERPVAAELCGGNALRSAGGYRQEGVPAPADRRHHGGRQRNLAGRRQLRRLAVVSFVLLSSGGAQCTRSVDAPHRGDRENFWPGVRGGADPGRNGGGFGPVTLSTAGGQEH